MWAATAESANLKVHNMKDINAGKREYSVSNCQQPKKLHNTNMFVTNLLLPRLSKQQLACFLQAHFIFTEVTLGIYESDELIKKSILFR